MGKDPLTPEAVDKIQKKLEDLQEKGIDIHEFEDGPLYKNYMDENGFVNPDYSPIAILDKVNDPKEKEELLSEHSDSITPMELNHFLDHIDSLYKEKKNAGLTSMTKKTSPAGSLFLKCLPSWK